MSDETIYGIVTSGIILQGTGQFIVTTDSTGLKPVSSINWGSITPGSTVNTIFYLRNIGSSPIIFNLSQTDWNPVNSQQYFQFSSTLTSTPLKPNYVRKVVASLIVLPSISGITNFSFTLIIRGVI